MSRRIPRRAWFALIVAAAAALGACAKPGEDRREVVSVWSTVPAPTLAPWVAAFEASSPRLRIVVRSLAVEGFADSIASALATGHAPDLATIPSEAFPVLMGQGVLSDWSAGVADLRGALEGWDLCMWGDAIYGLPWLLDTRVLYYNTQRWAAAGGAPGGPADEQALQQVAARERGALGLTRAGTPGAFAALAPWAWAAGAEVGTPSLDTVRIDSDVWARSLSALLALRRNARLASQDSLEDAFAEGRLTMLVAGADLASRLAISAPSLPVGAALVPPPVPGRSASSASVLSGTVLASFTTSRRKEDALRFARSLVEPEALARLALVLDGPVPALAHADTTVWAAGSPVRPALCRAVKASRGGPVHPAWPRIQAGLDSLLSLTYSGRLPVAPTLAAADTLLVRQARPR